MNNAANTDEDEKREQLQDCLENMQAILADIESALSCADSCETVDDMEANLEEVRDLARNLAMTR